MASFAGEGDDVTDVPILAIKALNGGLFVVAFALVGEILKPKRFAGLFSAAPSVALANLMVVIVTKGHPDAAANTKGMIVGGLALAASCLVGMAVVRRYRALRASVLVCVLWLVLAWAGYAVVLA